MSNIPDDCMTVDGGRSELEIADELARARGYDECPLCFEWVNLNQLHRNDGICDDCLLREVAWRERNVNP